MKDAQGNPVSHEASDAVAALSEGTAMLNAFRGDPVGVVAEALKAHPDFAMGHIFVGALFATAMDRTFEPHTRRALEAAEPLLGAANERERGHFNAVKLWAGGDIAGATEAWGRVAMDHPRDILAIQLAQQGDYFQGHSLMLRDRVLRVAGQWSPDVPGHSYVLGMLAFGHEEAGDYGRAEDLGRHAVEIDPRDIWAVHAVAHVYEMEGRASDGLNWLKDTREGWQGGALLACHVWWHEALMHLNRGEIDAALGVYDRAILTLGLKQSLELVDASALLWRIWALGSDVGGRWNAVADAWVSRVSHGINAFNDIHAVMAFAAAGRQADVAAQIATLERAAGEGTTNALMARQAGLPAARGFAAFGAGDHAGALRHFLEAIPRAAAFGGSHAQRDVLHWTAVEAAIRSGDRNVAQALVNERLARNPVEAVPTQGWLRRTQALAA